MMQVLAHTALHHLKGVGGAVGEKLARLGITTVQDLLFHLPRDYEDRSYITPIAGLAVGRSALLEGTVLAAEVLQGKRTSFVVRFTDGSGTLTLRFYHSTPSKSSTSSPASGCGCSARRGWAPAAWKSIIPTTRACSPAIPCRSHG